MLEAIRVRVLVLACNSRAAAATESMRPLSSSALIVLTLIPPPAMAAISSRAPDSTVAASVRASSSSAHVAPPAVTAAGDDLGPTTAPPWNPPHAIPRRETWEQVILFPQRVVTLPLSGLGWLADRSMLAIEKTSLVSQLIVPPPPGPPSRYGLRFGLPRLGDGTGVGLRVTARGRPFRGRLASTVAVSYAGTMRNYNDTRIGIYGPSGSLEYSYTWRPEDRFYGFGMRSSLDAESDYATRAEQARVTLGHGWNAREENGEPRTWVGAWVGPRWIETTAGRAGEVPSSTLLFPTVVAPTVDQRLVHLVYGARFTSDWRVGAPHWSRGWRVLIESQRFDAGRGPLALGLHGAPIAQFTRTWVEFETGFSFMRDPRSVRVMARLVDQGISAGRDRMALIDYTTFGAHDGLAGFDHGRFHDVDQVLTRVSYIFPLVRRLEIDLHLESGSAVDNVWHDLRLDGFRPSAGIALRGRTTTHPFGAIGFDGGAEGLRFRFSIGARE
jgi:hypothetical protein